MLNDLLREVTYETIVTTMNSLPNAAAIGIMLVDDTIQMKVFAGTNTYSNVKRNGRFAINFVNEDQLDLLTKAALTGHNSKEREFPDECYLYDEGIPHLAQIKNYLLCEIEQSSEKQIEDKIGRCNVLKIRAKILKCVVGEDISPIIMKENPLVEALIHATRYGISKGKVKLDYRKKVKYYLDSAVDNKKINENIEMIAAIKKYIDLED